MAELKRADGIEIRVNDRPSLPAFAELNRRWIEEMHHLECSDQEMVARPELYLENEGRVITAHVDGEVAGAVALKQHVSGTASGQWELTKMAVDPKFQGRGIGQVLMDAAHAEAKNKIGVDELFLLSNTRNEAALRLYARNGWTVNHEGTHPVYERCNIGMVKTL